MDAPDIQQQNPPIPGAVDVGNSGAPAQGQAPPQTAPAPAASQAPVAPAASAGTPPVVATSKNPQLHNLIAGILGGLAGHPPPSYSVDPNSGKMITTAAPPMSTADKIRRIASNALTGLAAGNGPQAKSGLASLLSGAGRGAEAVGAKMSAEDTAKRSQAKEDFEQEQQTKLRKMEIARANAMNMQLHFANRHQQNDLDPTRAQNKEIADSFRAMPDHGVREMSHVQADQLAQKDPTFSHTHLVLAAGFQDVTDSNGDPLKDAEGNYKSEGRVFVIDGMKDGKVPIPASIASDIQKYKNYGNLARLPGLDGIKAGDEYDADQFVPLYNALLSAKVEVEKGWSNPEVHEDKDGNIVQRNAVNDEIKPAIPAQVQKFQMDKATLAEKQQQVKTGKSTEVKNLAEADKAKKDTADAGPVSNLTGPDYLNSLSVGDRNTVQAIGEGRQVLSAGQLRTKDGQALAKKVNQAYPNFDETKSSAYAAMRKSFTSGKEAAGINAFNTALSHLGRAYGHVSAASTVPGVRTIAAWLGNTKATAFESDKAAVTGEIAKAYKGGVINKEEKEEYENLLGASTPANVKGNIKELAELLTGKLQAYQSQWESGMPSGVIAPFPIINSAGKAAYAKITGGAAEGSQSGQPNIPAGASQIGKDANGNVVGYVLNGQWVSIGGKQ